MTAALLILPADLRHTNAAVCLAQLQLQIRSSPTAEVEIQAGQLTNFDSAALAEKRKHTQRNKQTKKKE